MSTPFPPLQVHLVGEGRPRASSRRSWRWPGWRRSSCHRAAAGSGGPARCATARASPRRSRPLRSSLWQRLAPARGDWPTRAPSASRTSSRSEATTSRGGDDDRVRKLAHGADRPCLDHRACGRQPSSEGEWKDRQAGSSGTPRVGVARALRDRFGHGVSKDRTATRHSGQPRRWRMGPFVGEEHNLPGLGQGSRGRSRATYAAAALTHGETNVRRTVISVPVKASRFAPQERDDLSLSGQSSARLRPPAKSRCDRDLRAFRHMRLGGRVSVGPTSMTGTLSSAGRR